MKKKIFLILAIIISWQALASKVILKNKSGRTIEARPATQSYSGDFKTIKNNSESNLISALRTIDFVDIKDTIDGTTDWIRYPIKMEEFFSEFETQTHIYYGRNNLQKVE